MKILWFQICVIISVVIGALIVTNLTEKELAIFAGGTLGICALLGWILTFKNKGVKFRHDFPWTLLGNLQPVPSRWIKPLEMSWPERIIILAVFMLLGACVRIFWIVSV